MVRIKKRYFVLRLERQEDVLKASENKKRLRAASCQPLEVPDAALTKAVRDLLSQHYGDHGRAAAGAGLRAIYANSHTGLVLLCARHSHYKMVASVLPFLTQINEEKVVPRLIYTGATIRNCYQVESQHYNRRLTVFCPQVMEQHQRKELNLALKELSEDNPEELRLRKVMREKMTKLREMWPANDGQ